jgi:hypothetical protein
MASAKTIAATTKTRRTVDLDFIYLSPVFPMATLIADDPKAFALSHKLRAGRGWTHIPRRPTANSRAFFSTKCLV